MGEDQVSMVAGGGSDQVSMVTGSGCRPGLCGSRGWLWSPWLQGVGVDQKVYSKEQSQRNVRVNFNPLNNTLTFHHQVSQKKCSYRHCTFHKSQNAGNVNPTFSCKQRTSLMLLVQLAWQSWPWWTEPIKVHAFTLKNQWLVTITAPLP